MGGANAPRIKKPQKAPAEKKKVVVREELNVIIHPLVLLSTVDHYNRVAKDTRNRRVVGVLLGERRGNEIDVTNSFAVPFEEDRRDPNVWFMDHNYLDEMAGMFRRINAKELIVGFYSTGPQIRPADLQIADVFGKRHLRGGSDPIFAIIDVRADRDDEGIPIKAYRTAEEVAADGGATRRLFRHIPSRIVAAETEEVGVEHLLRDVNDVSVSTLAGQIKHKITALRGLRARLKEMVSYLQRVEKGEMKINNKIAYNMQNVLNLIPNLNADELLRAFFVKTNDVHLVIYVASMIRSVTALHDLVNNKLKYGDNPYDDDDVSATDLPTTKKAEDDTGAAEQKKGDSDEEEGGGGKKK
jgi:26S proteasome regulatory subunit N8